MISPIPKFSVVVPTCRRPAGLAACLDCLAPGRQIGARCLATVADGESASGATYEVIVSDAAADPECARMIAERYPWARWLPAAGCGPGPNRNTGASAARGEWIAFVDDDCLPESNWIALIAAAARSETDVVEGAVRSPDLPDHPLWTAPVNEAGSAGWTANLSVRRAVFEKLGGFDPDLPETAEDMEFHVRSKRAGCRWVFAADAAVVHPPRHMTWAQFWRDTLRFRWWFMFRLKTGNGPGPEAGALHSLADVVFTLGELYARNTWHLMRRLCGGERRGARRDVFLRLRDWILFPVLIPYFWRWTVRYRALLRERQHA